MAILRNTAYHIRISDILNSNFVKGEERSYLKYNGKEVSRINIIGIVVSKNENNIGFDDGTDVISLIEFDSDNLKNMKIGNVVLVVGRIWESNSQRYIVPEIAKKIDKKWMLVRAKELKNTPKKIAPMQELKQEKGFVEPKISEKKDSVLEEEIVEEVQDKTNDNSNILDFIKEHDDGDGVDIDLIILNKKTTEEKIQELLKAGEIFLVKPGFVKVLE